MAARRLEGTDAAKFVQQQAPGACRTALLVACFSPFATVVMTSSSATFNPSEALPGIRSSPLLLLACTNFLLGLGNDQHDQPGTSHLRRVPTFFFPPPLCFGVHCSSYPLTLTRACVLNHISCAGLSWIASLLGSLVPAVSAYGSPPPFPASPRRPPEPATRGASGRRYRWRPPEKAIPPPLAKASPWRYAPPVSGCGREH